MLAPALRREECTLSLALGRLAVHYWALLGGAINALKEQIKLNLGARNRPIPGFKGFDCDPHEGVDYVGDIRDLSMFKDGEVSEIYGSHVVEHVSHLETLPLLKEWARVLEPGGILYIAVPDFKRTVELYAQLGLSDWIVRFLMGDQEYKTAYHYNLFDEPRLTKLLREAGFCDVTRVDEFPIGDKHDCSRIVSTHDLESVSLNMLAIK